MGSGSLWIKETLPTEETMEKEQGSSKVLELKGDVAVDSAAAVLQEVVQMTGLPEDYLNSEISDLLGTAQSGVNELTLDQLRLVLLNYLETVNEEMTQEQDKH